MYTKVYTYTYILNKGKGVAIDLAVLLSVELIALLYILVYTVISIVGSIIYYTYAVLGLVELISLDYLTY